MYSQWVWLSDMPSQKEGTFPLRWRSPARRHPSRPGWHLQRERCGAPGLMEGGTQDVLLAQLWWSSPAPSSRPWRSASSATQCWTGVSSTCGQTASKPGRPAWRCPGPHKVWRTVFVWLRVHRCAAGQRLQVRDEGRPVRQFEDEPMDPVSYAKWYREWQESQSVPGIRDIIF